MFITVFVTRVFNLFIKQKMKEYCFSFTQGNTLFTI